MEIHEALGIDNNKAKQICDDLAGISVQHPDMKTIVRDVQSVYGTDPEGLLAGIILGRMIQKNEDFAENPAVRKQLVDITNVIGVYMKLEQPSINDQTKVVVNISKMLQDMMR